MNGNKKKTGYVVSHTHWDREWRYGLWQNRLHLERFMDLLLEILDTQPDYKTIVLDGQGVIVEDYLQVRPENTEKIKKYIQDGRIKIGPWYTLPDLYPVDGECLVRNLLKGRRYSESMGGVMNIAFTTFGWGQIAQFPQIFAGFDIDFIICGKNVSKERAPEIEFWWESPDGTRVLTSRLGEFARANFFMNAHIPIRFGIEYMSDDYRYKWGENGFLIHKATEHGYFEDYFKQPGEEGYFPEMIPDAVQKSWKAMDATTVNDDRLLMNGSDSSTPHTILGKLINDANEKLKDTELKHSSLEEYREVLFSKINREKLGTVEGEMRDGPPYATSANALATRIHIKQLNRQAENLLIRKTEPLSVLLAMSGEPYPAGYLKIAWDYLLKAHPHDSINGVGQDKVAEDNIFRLKQVLEIAEFLFDHQVSKLAQKIDLSGFEKKDILLLVVNTLPFPVSAVEKVCIDTPREHNVWEVAVEDSLGKQIPVQFISREAMTVPVDDMEARPWPFDIDRNLVYLDTGEIPAGGYKVLKVKAKSNFNRKEMIWPKVRMQEEKNISQLSNMLENENLKVVINSNGTINLFDKTNNIKLENTHYFEDSGDAGDYWVYYPPYENKTITSLGSNANIWLEDNGPLSATIAVALEMRVPDGVLSDDNNLSGKSKRSDKWKTISIVSRFTLCKGSQQVDVYTEIDNTAKDHRMRLILPTGIKTDKTYAAGHFNVDTRPAQPTRLPDGTFYPEMETLPQQNFVDISDGKKGFAILNSGFTEFEYLKDPDHSLAITLFRAKRNNVCTEFRVYAKYDNQKGGQIKQKLVYDYALFPHKGKWNQAQVNRRAQQLNVPISTYQINKHQRGSWPLEQSLFAIDSEDLMLSGIKHAEDRTSWIIRIYNPTDTKASGTLSFKTKIKRAYLCTLNEKRTEEIKISSGGEIDVTLEKGKIATIELEK